MQRLDTEKLGANLSAAQGEAAKQGEAAGVGGAVMMSNERLETAGDPSQSHQFQML